MNRPLDGVRIIDLSNMLMAPYATQILGDMGADVIKVEAPGGDPVRHIGPMRNPGMGAIYLNCNRSKRSIELNLKTPAGHQVLMALLKDADALVYNRRPQVMARLGLSYEQVAAVNPRIVYAGLFGYGQNGPYAAKPAFDDLIQGAVAIPSMGRMADDGKPRYAPTAIVDRGVALWAVGQINAALYYQARTGKGQRVDLPMFEMMATFVLADHLGGATFEPPEGTIGYPRLLSPERKPFPTKDGFICVMLYTDHHWRSFYKARGIEHEFDADPRMTSMTTRTENIDAIYGELATLLQTQTTEHWLELMDLADIPAMPLATAESLMNDPHLSETGFFSFVDHPSEGKLRDMAVPSSWSESQPAPTRHAPELGEHTDEILREAGYSAQQIDALQG